METLYKYMVDNGMKDLSEIPEPYRTMLWEKYYKPVETTTTTTQAPVEETTTTTTEAPVEETTTTTTQA